MVAVHIRQIQQASGYGVGPSLAQSPTTLQIQQVQQILRPIPVTIPVVIVAVIVVIVVVDDILLGQASVEGGVRCCCGWRPGQRGLRPRALLLRLRGFRPTWLRLRQQAMLLMGSLRHGLARWPS